MLLKLAYRLQVFEKIAIQESNGFARAYFADRKREAELMYWSALREFKKKQAIESMHDKSIPQTSKEDLIGKGIKRPLEKIGATYKDGTLKKRLQKKKAPSGA